MRPDFVKDAGGRTGSLVRHALAATAAAGLAMSAGAADGGASSTNNLAGANIHGGVVVLTETTTIDLGTSPFLDLGRGAPPPRAVTSMVLRPDRELVTHGTGNPHLKAMLSATFTLSGQPNQAFGISLPGATILNSGGSLYSVRSFAHDAGQTPAIGARGDTHFNIGAFFTLAKIPDRKDRTYIWAVELIISNN